MAPSAVREVESEQTFAVKSPRSNARYLMDRNLKKDYPVVVRANGNYIYFQDGRQILDSTSGAAVSCLGHRNKRVKKAMDDLEETGVAYLASNFYSHPVVNELAEEIIRGTDYKMARVYLTGSGSEAMEATIKLSRQFFWMDEKSRSRVNFIARETSYHGNTIGALGISGHKARRAPYEQFLMDNVYHVSACNPYRQRKNGQSDAEFVAAKADELDAKFRELGPETVIGFIMEPVVGAALGCVPYVPGYMKAMKEVCHKHGALFILDEVMCGMGRTGTLHAWQAENVVPDIQTVGKGLGGGFQPIAAVIISHKVVDALMNNTCEFIHGQTYQGMPIQAAAALEVQRIVREDKLMKNVQVQGLHLAKLLKSLLGDHPNVGDIRGMGLFWGIEFVKNKEEKTPFESAERIAQKVHATAMADPYNIALYPCTGCADGWSGDDIIIAPAYNISKEEVEIIANRTAEVIRKVFADFDSI